jgi:epoxide hydrolase-like predicted phosphatase
VKHRGVIFDLGGVVLGSPLHAIARYERDVGIPAGFINRTVVETAPGGAWPRLERGELDIEAFCVAFDAECAERGHPISAVDLMLRIAETAAPHLGMLEAIARIRSRGLCAAALTNNWVGDGDGSSALRPHFDVFVESSVVGLRKPDPRIYEHVCREMEVRPEEAVFLDDIGRNLKPARSLGMHTIKVEDPDRALEELERVLGFTLR